MRLDDCLPNEIFQRQRQRQRQQQHQCQWILCYLSKPFSMLVMDFGPHDIETLTTLLQQMPHPEDQNELSKEDSTRIINIHLMPDDWQQEFELNHVKTLDQSIRSLLP